MFAINISIVILMIINIFPSCHAECENYYLIMEQNFGDYFYYSPIKKDNITWTISNIHSNNDTYEFDMNCVLNLNCDTIYADRPQVVFIESTNKTKEKNTTAVDVILIPPELPESGTHGDTNVSGKYTNDNSSSEDGSLDPEITTDKNEIKNTENNDDGEIVDMKEINKTAITPKDGDTKSNTTKSNDEDKVVDKKNSTNVEIISKDGDTKSNTTRNSDEEGLVDKTKSTSTEITPSTSTEIIPSTSTKITPSRSTEIIPSSSTAIIPATSTEIIPVGGDIKSNSTDDSEVNPDKHTNVTDIVSGNVKSNNTNSTDDGNNDISKNVTDTASNSSDTNTTVLFSKVPKYDPEKSRNLASKVIAGTLGAVATVGVFILLKVGGTKLVEYCTQHGVYRLPNP